MIPIRKINECTAEAIRIKRQEGRILTGILFNNFWCQGNRSTETRLTIAGVRRKALSIQSIEFLNVNASNIVPRDRLLCPPVINGHHTGGRVIAILIFEIPAISVVYRGELEVEIPLGNGEGGVLPRFARIIWSLVTPSETRIVHGQRAPRIAG